MPRYGWKGPGQVKQLDLPRAQKPRVTKPSSVNPPTDLDEPERRVVCTVDGCGKKFKKNMIMARHFNANHESLREDKDSWRDHFKEVWE